MTSPSNMASLSGRAVLCAALARSVVAAPPSLDPNTYREPLESIYFGKSPDATRPYQEEHLKSSELTREDFDRRIMEGQIFVVEDLGEDWPMQQWDCDYFRTDPVFSKAEMNRQYAKDGGGGFVGFSSNWLDSKASSGAKDKEAPQVAPFYWGIKDVQYADAHRSKTWKKSMLKKVQEHVRLPHFMDPQNQRNFETTPEFWFAAGGAGAKAHMDTHVQATVSIQLAGTKRWRLSLMDNRTTAFLAMIYQDGDIYDRMDVWKPDFHITLQPGHALFFPPGTIHETLNVGDAESCTASVTFQFNSPMAVKMYRDFLPRVRRTADIHEAWPLLRTWASLRSKVDKKGLPYAEAKAQAMSASGVGAAFEKRDLDKDGFLSKSELEQAFPTDYFDYLGFHDLDEDGRVAREEFAEVFGLWAGTMKQVIEETPKKHQKLQVKDMEGEFNIEDLPGKLQKQLKADAFAKEEKLASAGKADSAAASAEL